MDPRGVMVISLQPKSSWDLAGAAAIIERIPELRLTDLDGKSIRFSGLRSQRIHGVICSHQEIYEHVFETLRRTGAQRSRICVFAPGPRARACSAPE